MARTYSHGFNKEKLIFMATSVALAGSAYLFFTTTPVQLKVGEPVSSTPAPTALPPAPSDARPVVEYYVLDGKLSKMIDQRTGKLVNRQRKTPFAPDAEYLLAMKKKEAKNAPPGIVGKAPPPPPPPPPGAPSADKNEETEKTFDAKDRIAKVAFVGVIMGEDGQTYGLVKPKDGGSPRRVKVGDKIPDLNYTVDKIEKQAIYVSDDDKTPFILKDSDEVADSGSGGDGEGDKSDKAEKKAAKKTAKKSDSSSKGGAAAAGGSSSGKDSKSAQTAAKGSGPGPGAFPGGQLPNGMNMNDIQNLKNAMKGGGIKSHPGRARQ